MTVYVCPFPFAADAYHLWADDPDEALCAAYACGASLADHRPERSALHYTINWQQLLEARALGAVDTDRMAPMLAAALYTGNMTGAQSVLAWRTESMNARANPHLVAVRMTGD